MTACGIQIPEFQKTQEPSTSTVLPERDVTSDYVQFANHVLSIEDLDERMSYVADYNCKKYQKALSVPETIPMSRTTTELIPVVSLSIRDCQFPQNAGEIDALGPEATQMRLLYKLPPSIVFVESADIALQSMLKFGIYPDQHVLIESPVLEGASWTQDWAADNIDVSPDGKYVAKTSTYADSRGFGGLLANTIQKLIPGISILENNKVESFEGGNFEPVIVQDQLKIFFVKGVERPAEHEQLQSAYPNAQLIELEPVGPVEHADEMLTIHKLADGSLVILISDAPVDADDATKEKFLRNERKIRENTSGAKYVNLPSRKLSMVNVSNFANRIIFPAYSDFSTAEYKQAEQLLKDAFPGYKVNLLEVDTGGSGGVNCLTGGIPIEIFFLFKAKLKQDNLQYFSG